MDELNFPSGDGEYVNQLSDDGAAFAADLQEGEKVDVSPVSLGILFATGAVAMENPLSDEGPIQNEGKVNRKRGPPLIFCNWRQLEELSSL
jgi:hypothetical protein